MFKRVYLAEGKREERLRALEAENEALRRAKGGERQPWDWSDARPP